jgi:hypothetical protein
MVTTMNDNQDAKLELRARETFDASVDALDAHTRSRLTQARHRALAELERGGGSGWRSWRAAVALGAGALLAVVLLWRPDGNAPSQANADLLLDEIELVAEGEDLDLAREELEFYAFVANEAPYMSNGSG